MAIKGAVQSVSTAVGSDFTFQYPAGAAVGDWIVIQHRHVDTDPAWPAGWEKIGEVVKSGDARIQAHCHQIAGGDSLASVTVQLNTALGITSRNYVCWLLDDVHRIRNTAIARSEMARSGWQSGALPYNFSKTANSSNPNHFQTDQGVTFGGFDCALSALALSGDRTAITYPAALTEYRGSSNARFYSCATPLVAMDSTQAWAYNLNNQIDYATNLVLVNFKRLTSQAIDNQYVKQFGAWKKPQQTLVKGSGSWQAAKEIFVKDSSNWNKVYGQGGAADQASLRFIGPHYRNTIDTNQNTSQTPVPYAIGAPTIAGGKRYAVFVISARETGNTDNIYVLNGTLGGSLAPATYINQAYPNGNEWVGNNQSQGRILLRVIGTEIAANETSIELSFTLSRTVSMLGVDYYVLETGPAGLKAIRWNTYLSQVATYNVNTDLPMGRNALGPCIQAIMSAGTSTDISNWWAGGNSPEWVVDVTETPAQAAQINYICSHTPTYTNDLRMLMEYWATSTYRRRMYMEFDVT